MNDFFDNIDNVCINDTSVHEKFEWKWKLSIIIPEKQIEQHFKTVKAFKKMLDMSLNSVVLKDSDISYKIEIKDMLEKPEDKYSIPSIPYTIYLVKILFNGNFGSIKDVILFLNATNITKNIRHSTPFAYQFFSEHKTFGGTLPQHDMFSVYGWSLDSLKTSKESLHNIALICQLCLEVDFLSVFQCAYMLNCIPEHYITICRDYCMSIFSKVPEYNGFEASHYGSYFFDHNHEVKYKIIDVFKKATRISKNGLKMIMRNNIEGIKKAIGVFNVENITQFFINTQHDVEKERHFMLYEPNCPEFQFVEFIEAFINQSEKLSEKTFRDIPFKNRILVEEREVILVTCVGTLFRSETNTWYIGYVGLKGDVDKVVDTLNILFGL